MMLTTLSVSGRELALALLLIVALIFSLIALTRNYLKQKSQHLQTGKSKLRLAKYPEVDVFRMSGTFFTTALMSALLLTVLAFNWTTYKDDIFIPDGAANFDEEIELIPRTEAERKEPPPPPPPPPTIEVSDEILEEDEPVFEDIYIDTDDEITASKESALPPPPPPPPPPVEDAPPLIFVEKMPRFPGCENIRNKEEREVCAQNEMLKFIYKNIDYPTIAIDTGVEGTVVIRFVVEKDGSIANAEIVRDIGAGCGKEALRVVKMMPKWIPGKQSGRPVRVLFTLPVKFQLER